MTRPSMSFGSSIFSGAGSPPFSQITRVGNPSSTAPSHTSRAECEPIVAIRRADGLYVSRTLRIASRPTIVPVPSRCRPMVPPSLILWESARKDPRGTSLSADSLRAMLDARLVRAWGRRVGDDGIAVTEFSARTRAANLERMRKESFDVLVVGGGVVGAAVARDVACRGFATALVDRGDFASGTRRQP